MIVVVESARCGAIRRSREDELLLLLPFAIVDDPRANILYLILCNFNEYVI
jgi:hypothetical protein